MALVPHRDVDLSSWRPRARRDVTPGQQLARFLARALGLPKKRGKELAKVRAVAMVTPVALHDVDLGVAAYRFFSRLHRSWSLALLDGDAEREAQLWLDFRREGPRISRALPAWGARIFFEP